jgi:hypothetical protein
MPDNEVQIVVTAIDNASKVLVGLSRAFNSISGAVKDVTKAYVDYGTQVQKLSLFTGMTNEETSRMIQLADDAFVSVESLQMGLRYMSENGVVPSVEGLIQLSDEFNSIEDPLARSQFLLDKFGRSGMEMAKVMELGGDNIREMNQSIADGLIIDDQKQQRIQETKRRLDDFNDSLEAMRYDVADKLLTIFEGMPKPLQDSALALGQFLSPQNVNTLVQFGILLKGINFSGIVAGVMGAAKWMRAFVSLIGEAGLLSAIKVAIPQLYSLGAAAWASIGPFALLAGAIALLVKVIHDNWATIQKAAAIVSYGVTGKLPDYAWNIKEGSGGALDVVNGPLAQISSGPDIFGKYAAGGILPPRTWGIVGEEGPEAIYGGSTGATILPNSAMSPVQIVYAPTFSTASRAEFDAQMRPLIEDAIRRKGRYG